MKTYRMSHKGAAGASRAAINVPAHIARCIPDGMEFAVELTDDGILYRPVGVAPPEAELPDWVTSAFRRAGA